MDTNVFRQIPKMDILLQRPAVIEAAGDLPRPLIKRAVQGVLDALRQTLADGGALPEESALDRQLTDAIRAAGALRLRRVINATGVVLHTNLGRAPLGSAVAGHVADVAAGYSTLEYDLDAGTRGSRHDLVERQLCRLTGAEAAMVVNNNAAAVFLMLHTLASGKKVAVSRGELVEIGGAFRVPEIMAASGAELLEIGTTNKTHAADYEAALAQENVAALLKVHTSNFAIIGFSESVDLSSLSQMAADHGVPLLYDLGAGFLVRPEQLGLHEGVYVPDAVKLADVCCFSGDKLFGAGQAGILLGKADLIGRMKRDQLARMLRVDKMTLASVEAALRLYEDPALAAAEIPALSMLSASAEELKTIAEALAADLCRTCGGDWFTAVPCTDEPGGGSLPTVQLPGWAVCAEIPGMRPDALEAALRALPTPVIGRICKGHLLLSVRTLLPDDRAALLAAMADLEVKA